MVRDLEVIVSGCGTRCSAPRTTRSTREKYGFLEDVATTKSLYDKRLVNVFELTHLGRFSDYRVMMILSLLQQQFKKLVGFMINLKPIT